MCTSSQKGLTAPLDKLSFDSLQYFLTSSRSVSTNKKKYLLSASPQSFASSERRAQSWVRVLHPEPPKPMKMCVSVAMVISPSISRSLGAVMVPNERQIFCYAKLHKTMSEEIQKQKMVQNDPSRRQIQPTLCKNGVPCGNGFGIGSSRQTRRSTTPSDPCFVRRMEVECTLLLDPTCATSRPSRLFNVAERTWSSPNSM